MIYYVDIDGTILDTQNSDYENSKPFQERIDKMNALYDEGHEIHYYTARGAKSGTDWKEYTQKFLLENGVKYTSCNVGKPHYDVWIDDKAINSEDFFKWL